MSSGVPQSSSQTPAPGRSERQTALFRVFVFEAEDGDIICVKEDERSLLSLMVKASKGDVSLASFASFNVRALSASKKNNRKSQLRSRVTCGLVKHPYGADASDDERFGGAAQLFHACGFTLSDGTTCKVKLVDDVASTGLEDAWVCRLHTFAHTD